ncbi:hypothetical protein [Rudanella lutea]|uniref:hypothetical protein n=1 Tax=Rudanella lutea TaxID=451374 RepID=UPI000370637E|nr:hypothetical protein [Rudanella lutea]
MKYTFVIAGLLLGTMACQNDQSEAIKAAESEVFKLHDEVMPLTMNEIPKLQKALRSRISTLDSLTNRQPSEQVRNDETKEEISRINRSLSQANESMDVWMSQYNGDTLTKISGDEALRYLADQKEKITDVNKQVNESIKQARQYLGAQ